VYSCKTTLITSRGKRKKRGDWVTIIVVVKVVKQDFCNMFLVTVTVTVIYTYQY
jgi:hypothetical protein